MELSIAVSGKGGVGKTTIAGLIVLRLIQKGRRPVLAIDADPNSCLDAALGVRVEKTVGGVREEAREIAKQENGISKQALLELKISQSLVEADDFDLIAMGRPEGPGCYCFANNVLRATIASISSQYPYMVLDNEAGLENLSRRIVQQVDLLVMVSDPSYRGLQTLERIHDLAKEMDISYKRLALVVNRLRTSELSQPAQQLMERTQADFIIGLPNDEELAESAERGLSLGTLTSNNRVVLGIDSFLDTVLQSTSI